MKELIQKLAVRRDMQIQLRREPLTKPLGAEPPMIEVDGKLVPLPRQKVAFPPELEQFRQLVQSARLFPRPREKPPALNGWSIVETEFWVSNNVNEILVHGLASGGVDYLETVFVLAHSEVDGVIAVDTHSNRFGWIGYYWYQISLEAGGYPIVARSFREWLERTAEAGPDRLYWEQEGFKDLGPAIPDDPNYQGPNAR